MYPSTSKFHLKKQLFTTTRIVALCSISYFSQAQMITGYWKGKVARQKAEIKIIQNGDSLAGTSYYYESANNYRRYTIKGYFNKETNSTVWWDDQLIEERSGRLSIGSPGRIPILSEADFNCPGSGRMMLDGKITARDKEDRITGEVHLNKTDRSSFDDEWDFVIDNYQVGANDPDLIDSVATVYLNQTKPHQIKTVTEVPVEKEVVKNPPAPRKEAVPVVAPTDKAPIITVADKPAPIEEKFKTREKVFIKEIPLTGDSIELRFYDNAEIDGDSISLFLNDRMIFQHIRLAASPYVIKLPVNTLGLTNELTMVAENLGTIPPNTSYMVAIVGDKRYDAYLSSSEGSSAMIRLTKK
jgi:hypothetical protein